MKTILHNLLRGGMWGVLALAAVASLWVTRQAYQSIQQLREMQATAAATTGQGPSESAEATTARAALNQRLTQLEKELDQIALQLQQAKRNSQQARRATFDAEAALARIRDERFSRGTVGAAAGAVSVADACAASAAIGYPCHD